MSHRVNMGISSVSLQRGGRHDSVLHQPLSLPTVKNSCSLATLHTYNLSSTDYDSRNGTILFDKLLNLPRWLDTRERTQERTYELLNLAFAIARVGFTPYGEIPD